MMTDKTNHKTWMFILTMITLERSNKAESVFAGNWCTHIGAVMIAGDFNGNGYDDVMCYDSNGRHWKIDDRLLAQGRITGFCLQSPEESSSQYLEGLNELCMLSSQTRHVGDFDGDGADDILCHYILTGFNWIALASRDGTFQGITWTNAKMWCWYNSVSEGKVLVGDFNGDKRKDMLCHKNSDGYKWVTIARPGSFFSHGTDWELNMGWCLLSNIYVGDFDGDKIDDILCHDPTTGSVWIANSKVESSMFKGFLQAYYGNIGWCTHAGSVFGIGYMNNDFLADLLCYDNRGYIWVHLNHPTSRFNLPHPPYFLFCPGNITRLHVGYFTSTSNQQFLCATAPEWRILSNFL